MYGKCSFALQSVTPTANPPPSDHFTGTHKGMSLLCTTAALCCGYCKQEVDLTLDVTLTIFSCLNFELKLVVGPDVHLWREAAPMDIQ